MNEPIYLIALACLAAVLFAVSILVVFKFLTLFHAMADEIRGGRLAKAEVIALRTELRQRNEHGLRIGQAHQRILEAEIWEIYRREIYRRIDESSLAVEEKRRCRADADARLKAERVV